MFNFVNYLDCSPETQARLPFWCAPDTLVFCPISGCNEPIMGIYWNVPCQDWRIQVPYYEGTPEDYEPYREDKPTNTYEPAVTLTSGYVSRWRRLGKTRPKRPSKPTEKACSPKPNRPTPVAPLVTLESQPKKPLRPSPVTEEKKQKPKRPSPKTT